MASRNRLESHQIHTRSDQTYTDTYQIRTLVHSRYKSHQIHILGSYRFRTYKKTNRFIGLYQNHIQTYTYSCQGIRFFSFTCFMNFSGFSLFSCSCHLHNFVYLYLMTFNRILTSPVRVELNSFLSYCSLFKFTWFMFHELIRFCILYLFPIIQRETEVC